MNCQTCGRPLPPGVQVCPNCGAATPYNVAGPGMEPTVLASPPGGSGIPPTQYSSTPQNYQAPPPPPNPYGAPEIPNQYGTPPPSYPAYGAPPQQPGGYGIPPQQPKKRSRVGLIIGIVLGVVLLVCIGTFVTLYEIGKNAANTVVSSVDATATAIQQTATVTGNNAAPTSVPTTAPTTASGPPSGNTIDATAASIITNLKTASAIDSNYKPTNVTNTFQTNQTIYVTYNLNLNGQTGYIEVKWYVAGQVGASKIFNANNPQYTDGYFSETYKVPAQGSAELYFCTQSDCSDEALAGYVTFTVTSSGYHVGSHSPIAFSMDVNRRD